MNCIPLSAAELALQARLLQLPVALSMDLRLSAHEHVLRRDVANGTVQGDVVVMLRRLSIGAEPKLATSIDQRRSPLRQTITHLTEGTTTGSGKRRSRRAGKGK
jgi:hypothetical protein